MHLHTKIIETTLFIPSSGKMNAVGKLLWPPRIKRGGEKGCPNCGGKERTRREEKFSSPLNKGSLDSQPTTTAAQQKEKKKKTFH